MKIKDIKTAMLQFVDFYGQDLVKTDEIQKAKTKQELSKIVQDHIRFLQDQNIDAIKHTEDFMAKLKLNY